MIGTAGLANFGSPEQPSYYGVVVFVKPERQGKGVGRRLMEMVEAKARELGTDRITVRAAIGARGFYDKLGYRCQDGLEKRDAEGNYVLQKVLRHNA